MGFELRDAVVGNGGLVGPWTYRVGGDEGVVGKMRKFLDQCCDGAAADCLLVLNGDGDGDGPGVAGGLVGG